MPREVLPTNVRPFHYTLELEPNLDNFTFIGREAVFLEVLEYSVDITLNCKDINIDLSSVLSRFPGSDDSKCKSITYDTVTERVTFHFNVPISPTKQGYLMFEYTGVIGEMAGFYRTKYTNSKGLEVYGATTQFESTDARKAFVCGDEPALKATYSVTLIVPKELTALSNMPETSSIEYPNDATKKIVSFDKTPVMSTYLLAFYIGEVEYVEQTVYKTHSKQPTVVRVYTQPGDREEGRFALDVACKSVKEYETWFGLDYQLPKMDLISIPDFGSGAMENWGLITFRSKYLLYNPKTTSAKLQIIQAVVICHEIAHQWFGNLVTMDWWSGLWLNEGFATWMEWYMTDKLFPEWKVWEMFQSDDLSSALTLDELDNSHPVTNSVDKATEVAEVFDSITYQKGAAVIVMLVSWLGDDVFKRGIQSYMKRYQYSNATTEDLWTCLSEISGKDVSKMMTGWIDQVGYPVVEVSDIQVKDKNTSLTVQQRRYRTVYDKNKNYNDPTWIVPLNVLLTDDKGQSRVLRTEFSEGNAIINVVTGDNTSLMKYTKINAGQTGFYRALYSSPASLKILANAVKIKSISPIDRAEIISNMFAFAASGYLDVNIVLKFLEDCYLNELNYEDTHIVWSAIVTGIASIRSVWWNMDGVKNKFGQILLPIASYIFFSKYRWDPISGESFQDVQLRAIMLGILGRYGDKTVMVEAQRRFDVWISNPEEDQTLHSDIRSNVLAMLVRYGSRDNFNKLLTVYTKVKSSIIQGEILRTLGYTNNSEDLIKALDFSFKSGVVRIQDSWYPSISAGSGNLRLENWTYITNNWDHICTIFKDSPRLLGYLVQYSIEGLSDQKLYNEIVQFLDSKKETLKENQKTVDQSLEVVQKHIKWIERDTDKLVNWIKYSPGKFHEAY